jgi:hypothetical protein
MRGFLCESRRPLQPSPKTRLSVERVALGAGPSRDWGRCGLRRDEVTSGPLSLALLDSERLRSVLLRSSRDTKGRISPSSFIMSRRQYHRRSPVPSPRLGASIGASEKCSIAQPGITPCGAVARRDAFGVLFCTDSTASTGGKLLRDTGRRGVARERCATLPPERGAKRTALSQARIHHRGLLAGAGARGRGYAPTSRNRTTEPSGEFRAGISRLARSSPGRSTRSGLLNHLHIGNNGTYVSSRKVEFRLI